jgi:hypothetical protein
MAEHPLHLQTARVAASHGTPLNSSTQQDCILSDCNSCEFHQAMVEKTAVQAESQFVADNLYPQAAKVLMANIHVTGTLRKRVGKR